MWWPHNQLPFQPGLAGYLTRRKSSHTEVFQVAEDLFAPKAQHMEEICLEWDFICYPQPLPSLEKPGLAVVPWGPGQILWGAQYSQCWCFWKCWVHFQDPLRNGAKYPVPFTRATNQLLNQNDFSSLLHVVCIWISELKVKGSKNVITNLLRHLVLQAYLTGNTCICISPTGAERKMN